MLDEELFSIRKLWKLPDLLYPEFKKTYKAEPIKSDSENLSLSFPLLK